MEEDYIDIPDDYPFTECEICGEEFCNSQLTDFNNQTVCHCCAGWLEDQQSYKDDYYDDDDDYDYDDI